MERCTFEELYSLRIAVSRSARVLERRIAVFRDIFWFDGFFNLHISKLIGVEDLATLQALDKLGVFVPGNDTYTGVFADGCHRLESLDSTTLSARL